jgi:hypothetical protein
MAIVYCSNPFAGKDQGYDPNGYSADPAVNKLHADEAHEVTFEGCVLRTGEHNWHDDSDFYALVWDEEQGKVREIEYATTRGWTYHNSAKVDATPEARAKAVAWQAAQLFELYVEKAVAANREELERIDLGMEVRSTTTRGKNKGVVGTVEWIGANGYGPGYRVGLHVEGEIKRRYLDLERVERTDLPEDMDAANAPCADDLEGPRRRAAANAASYLKN